MELTDNELFEVSSRWLFLHLETDDRTVKSGESVVDDRAHTVRAAAEATREKAETGSTALRLNATPEMERMDSPAKIRERAGNVNWHNPVWQHGDGSVTEW